MLEVILVCPLNVATAFKRSKVKDVKFSKLKLFVRDYDSTLMGVVVVVRIREPI